MSTPIQEIETKLRQAITNMRELGHKVAPNSFGVSYSIFNTRWLKDSSPCLCPIGCVLIDSKKDGATQSAYEAHMGVAARLLGITANEIADFINGFDGGTLNNSPYFGLGQKFRQELYAPTTLAEAQALAAFVG